MRKLLLLSVIVLVTSCQQKSIHDKEMEKLNELFPNPLIVENGGSGNSYSVMLDEKTFYRVDFNLDGSLKDTINGSKYANTSKKDTGFDNWNKNYKKTHKK